MRACLHEMEVNNARQAQIEVYKAKLNARLSLQKGGNLIALDALNKVKLAKRNAAEKAVRKARRKIILFENKARNELYKRGVQARKDEKACLHFISANQILGV